MVWHLEKYSEIHSRICCLPHLTSSPPHALYYICIPNIKGILLPRLCYMFPCITLLVALRVHPAVLSTTYHCPISNFREINLIVLSFMPSYPIF